MSLTLPHSFIHEIIAHAQEDAPNECCGIIAGEDGRAVKLFRAKNAEASPYRYSVEPKDLFRIYRECDENGWSFLAIYHSHTASEAYPSPTDVRLAFWPEAYYVLVSLKDAKKPVVRAFRIQDGAVSEDEIEPASG
ncbi:MAG TPA: M67 family metallopeptidase [Dehalococcoidia bacterium]|nr:M67 family metallopeptidase [Dehalococcoidia bacterium]